MPDTDDIYAAKLRVQQRVPYIRKTGRVKMTGGQYSYASESDLLAALRPVLLEEGITWKPAEVEVVHQTATQVRVKVRWQFRHVPSATTDDVWVLGEGTDKGDKAASKASTLSHKYALRLWLGIETGDDPDRVAGDRESPGARAAREALEQAPDLETLEAEGRAIHARSFTAAERQSLRDCYHAQLQRFGRRARAPAHNQG